MSSFRMNPTSSWRLRPASTSLRFGSHSSRGQEQEWLQSDRAVRRDFFLPSEYNRNPFRVASQRLERKRTYQQQRAEYDKLVTQSRTARFVGATINWSPWVVFLSGSKLIERFVGSLPPNATLPGLIAFSIATTPFLAEIQEKVMKFWKSPPELLKKKQELDTLSQATAPSQPVQDAARQAERSPTGSSWHRGWLPGQTTDYDALASGICIGLISRYQDQQDAVKKALPQLRGAYETRKYLLPALERLQAAANEQTALLAHRSATPTIDAIAETMVDYSIQERNLLHKTVDLASERQRYSAHLRRMIPELIRYLGSSNPARYSDRSPI